ncbi:MAG: Gfo/Idh/MocA family oxidoreductase [Chloroflexi bacterium]|nr:Gfo/Idh/MocA family oxidoreductase [Chloroflexota bacterium]
MPDRIGVAFVGCTHPHIFPRLELLRGASGVEIVGCYDPDENLSRVLEKEHGVKAYASPQEVLDRPGVNFVVIEGWDPDNHMYVREAVKRRQAMLLEKPGAGTLDQMRKLTSDVRSADVPFQVGYMLRHSSATAAAKRIIQEDILGPITLARFHAAAPVGGAREPWQSVPGDMGGCVFTDGCHMIDQVVHLLGAPKRVKGMTLTLPTGPTVTAHGFKKETLSSLDVTVEMPLGGLMYEDAGAAILDYGDKLVTFDLTGWEAHPWTEAWRIELYGVDGTLHLGLQPPWYRLYIRNPKPGYAPGWHSWEAEGVTGVVNSLVVDENYRGEMEHMLRRVRMWDTDNEPWLFEAEAVIAVLDGIFRSEKQGDAVTLDLRHV